MVALGVGVGGFEFLGRQVEAPLRIVRAARVYERTAEMIPGSGHQPIVTSATVRSANATSMSAGDDIDMHVRQSAAAVAPPAAPVALPAAAVAQVEALSAIQPARAPDSGVQATARELRSSTPTLVPGERLQVPVSFYYCQTGMASSARGDGGGFCGVMRDGSRVYAGAAACAAEYLGQLFKIVGDPTGRIYKCADTGSAVAGVHRDIWFDVNDDGWVWQRSVGRVATIEILP